MLFYTIPGNYSVSITLQFSEYFSFIFQFAFLSPLPHLGALWTVRILPVLYLTVSSYMKQGTHKTCKSRLLPSPFQIPFLLSGDKSNLDNLLFETHLFFFCWCYFKRSSSKEQMPKEHFFFFTWVVFIQKTSSSLKRWGTGRCRLLFGLVQNTSDSLVSFGPPALRAGRMLFPWTGFIILEFGYLQCDLLHLSSSSKLHSE